MSSTPYDEMTYQELADIHTHMARTLTLSGNRRASEIHLDLAERYLRLASHGLTGRP